MAEFWFNRMAEHWTVPQRLDLVEHVRRGRVQLVQMGTYGPMFYGLADDAEVERSWAGHAPHWHRGGIWPWPASSSRASKRQEPRWWGS